MKTKAKTKQDKKPKLTTTRIFALKLSKPGLAVGALFFAFSLFPSMLPRTYIVQSVISALHLLSAME